MIAFLGSCARDEGRGSPCEVGCALFANVNTRRASSAAFVTLFANFFNRVEEISVRAGFTLDFVI